MSDYNRVRSVAAKGAAIALASALALPALANEDASGKNASQQSATSQGGGDVNLATNNSDSGPNNDFYWWSVDKFVGTKVMGTDGKTLGTVEKVVVDTMENRGEAIIALNDGPKIVLPLREFRVKDGHLMPEQDLTASSQIDELSAVYEDESGGDHWKQVASADMIGKFIYAGNNDYAERITSEYTAS